MKVLIPVCVISVTLLITTFEKVVRVAMQIFI